MFGLVGDMRNRLKSQCERVTWRMAPFEFYGKEDDTGANRGNEEINCIHTFVLKKWFLLWHCCFFSGSSFVLRSRQREGEGEGE